MVTRLAKLARIVITANTARRMEGLAVYVAANILLVKKEHLSRNLLMRLKRRMHDSNFESA